MQTFSPSIWTRETVSISYEARHMYVYIYVYMYVCIYVFDLTLYTRTQKRYLLSL